MRSINKYSEPAALKQWKKQMKDSPQNMDYGNLDADTKQAIKQSLLTEQGYLCAYTLLRLETSDACHIEHIRPQNDATDSALDYENMAACFPQSGGDTRHGFGAPIKAGVAVILNENFVSPHSLGCERRFRYDGKGGISAADGDTAAQKTIAILKLDHDNLADLRRRAIQAHGLSLRPGTRKDVQKPLTAAQAKRLAAAVLEKDNGGKLEPFCVVLSQVALEYAAKEESRAQRIRAQHGDRTR